MNQKNALMFLLVLGLALLVSCQAGQTLPSGARTVSLSVPGCG